jgi:hypothetical protein
MCLLICYFIWCESRLLYNEGTLLLHETNEYIILSYLPYLFTDGWNRNEFHFTKLSFGKWELTIPPAEDGVCRIPHNSSMKV